VGAYQLKPFFHPIKRKSTAGRDSVRVWHASGEGSLRIVSIKTPAVAGALGFDANACKHVFRLPPFCELITIFACWHAPMFLCFHAIIFCMLIGLHIPY